jgi:hypothetical protein
VRSVQVEEVKVCLVSVYQPLAKNADDENLHRLLVPKYTFDHDHDSRFFSHTGGIGPWTC